MESSESEDIKGTPKLPPPVISWHMYNNIYNNSSSVGDTEDDKISSKYSRILLLKRLYLESTKRCESCSGFGHVKQGCKTTKTLDMLGNVDAYYNGFIQLAQVDSEY